MKTRLITLRCEKVVKRYSQMDVNSGHLCILTKPVETIIRKHDHSFH